jgi:hypothetical protein
VQFLLDGANLGRGDDDAVHAQLEHHTARPTERTTISARARDAVGNQTTSAVVSVTVSNAAPDTTPPT